MSKILEYCPRELLVVIIFFICYTLGIFVDRLSDVIFSKKTTKIRNEILCNNPDSSIMRFIICENNEPLNRFLEYTRTRIRIARATTINLPIITVCVVLFGFHKENFNSVSGILIIVFGILFTILSFFSWKQSTENFWNLIKKMYYYNKSKKWTYLGPH
jgi:hypothetical protein